MRDERLELAGIPTRLYEPTGASGLLLFGHGGGHGKDSPRCVDLARRYAHGTGLAVVCIDAVDHGERKPTAGSAGLPPGWHSSVAERMVQDWRKTAEALSSIGPAVAYAGFSMGSIFGFPTVAAMPTIRAAFFCVGGVPSAPWLADPRLTGLLKNAAAGLGSRQVLMSNKTDDEIVPIESAHDLFEAIPGQTKRLMFWPGPHDDWPEELLQLSTDFITRSL